MYGEIKALVVCDRDEGKGEGEGEGESEGEGKGKGEGKDLGEQRHIHCQEK